MHPIPCSLSHQVPGTLHWLSTEKAGATCPGERPVPTLVADHRGPRVASAVRSLWPPVDVVEILTRLGPNDQEMDRMLELSDKDCTAAIIKVLPYQLQIL